MKPIRCIHVITRLILGGAQENTLLTVEGLDRMSGLSGEGHARYRTTLVTGPAIGPEGDLIERARRNDVDLVVLPNLRREISLWRDTAALHDLTRIFRQERPEIVHTHSSKAGILGRMAAHRAGVPIILHTVHGPPFHTRLNPLTNKFFQWLERRAARYSSRIISVADAMTETFVNAGVAPSDKFVTIYSGMEVEPFLREDGARDRVRSELGIAGDATVIGKIARLFHLKGHQDVLQAFVGIADRFPKAHLLFIGDGILREKLTAMAHGLGIGDRVIFAGLIPPDRIPAMIKAMDVLVHASLREGLARVLPQALLSARPVISYDVDGAREVVRDGVTGFLVRAESVDGLRDAMVRALSDLDGARAMALRGRELFTDQFRAETMVRRIVEVYEEELTRHGMMPHPLCAERTGE